MVGRYGDAADRMTIRRYPFLGSVSASEHSGRPGSPVQGLQHRLGMGFGDAEEGAGGFLSSAKDGTAFLEAGGELLEEFFFPGIQGERISGSPGRWKEWKSPRLRVKNRFAPALRAAKR